MIFVGKIGIFVNVFVDFLQTLLEVIVFVCYNGLSKGGHYDAQTQN